MLIANKVYFNNSSNPNEKVLLITSLFTLLVVNKTKEQVGCPQSKQIPDNHSYCLH